MAIASVEQTGISPHMFRFAVQEMDEGNTAAAN